MGAWVWVGERVGGGDEGETGRRGLKLLGGAGPGITCEGTCEPSLSHSPPSTTGGGGPGSGA